MLHDDGITRYGPAIRDGYPLVEPYRIMESEVTNMTPNQLAGKLAGDANAERIGKAFVRPFLRRHYARDASLKGSSWNLTDEQRDAVTAAYKARTAGKPFDFDAWRKARRARKPKRDADVSVTPTP